MRIGQGHLLPARRSWPAPYLAEIGRAVIGLLIGFALALPVVWFCMAYEYGQFMGTGRTIGENIAAVLGIWLRLTAIGTAFAFMPMLFVMTIERFSRMDLGAVTWGAIGATCAALLVLGMTHAPSLTAAAATASGGAAGMVAQCLRSSTHDRTQRPPWSLVIVVYSLILGIATLIWAMPIPTH